MQGMISAFDTKGGYGIIDADDGQIVFFNLDNVESGDPSRITVGTRVEFHSHDEDFGPHADRVLVPA